MREKGGSREPITGFYTPTSRGMRNWYARKVPKCRRCRKKYLILTERRQSGLCAGCNDELKRRGARI